MTDKERIEKTYQKIQKKHPHITNKDEIVDLAIKLDKRNTVLFSVGWLIVTIVCGVLFFLLIENETFESSSGIFLAMSVTGVFECFRTLGKYSKIEQKHRPVVRVKNEGRLTKEKILKDGGGILKKAGYAFNIFKLPLQDKEDDDDIDDGISHHKYWLHFMLPENSLKLTYKVKRTQYLDAVIGVEYFVVVTPSNKIAAVYQATNWSIDDALGEFMVDTMPQEPSHSDESCVVNEVPSENEVFQPTPIKTTAEQEKTKKLLPILSLVLTVLGSVIPMILGIPMVIAGLVLSIIGLVKQRTKLSITALVIGIIMLLIMIVAVTVIIMEIVWL